MTRDRDRFEDYPVLSEIKLSAHEREEIWQSIDQGMQQTRIYKTRRGITMMKTSVAAVVALALFGGGIGYEVHHTGVSTQLGTTTTSRLPGSTTTSYANQIALIKQKGYSVVHGSTPNAIVKTATGETLSAWICVLTASQDGHNLRVLFFLNGKYVGMDSRSSLEITSAKSAGSSIVVRYPVYTATDSLANPTGTPVSITYTWNGSKIVANKPYPKQFQASHSSGQGQSPITTTSYSSAAEALHQVKRIEGAFGSGGQRVNLGHGITAWATGAMGQARYDWSEGNWNIEIRFYTVNQGVGQVAKNVVTYLHTHWLPAPNKQGVIVVQSTTPSPSALKWHTTISWQEGSKMNELQQTGNPLQALQTVVNKG